MRVIIAGPRDVYAVELVFAAVAASGFAVSEVVSGCARGVDGLGEVWAVWHGVPVQRVPADWKRHGKAAGPLRNRLMAWYAHALVALWDGQSRGTGSMISQAKRRGLPTYVHRIERPTAARQLALL